MANVIKNIKCESYEGQFTGMVSINLVSEVDGNIIDADGVFTTGKTNKIRLHINYLMYVLRNTGEHCAAISCWLDTLKSVELPMRIAAWSLALNGQEIDLEAKLQPADDEHSEEWYSHEITSVNISEAAINAAYLAMARALVPGISIMEAREMAKSLRPE